MLNHGVHGVCYLDVADIVDLVSAVVIDDVVDKIFVDVLEGGDR